MLHDQYKSIDNIKTIEAKTLVFVAEKDNIIPAQNTYNLINQFPENQIKVINLKNSDHNNVTSNKNYNEALQLFFQN